MGTMKKDIRIVKPPVLQILKRIFILAIALLGAPFTAFTMFASGVSWIYDTDRQYSPFLGCPDFVLNANNAYPSGPMCRTTFKYAQPFASMLIGASKLSSGGQGISQIGLCTLSSSSSPEWIYCYADSSCDSVCSEESTGRRCPDPSSTSLPQCVVQVPPLISITMPCFDVVVDPFCDHQFKVTPSNEIAMRGIVIASLMIILIWSVAEMILRGVEIQLRREAAEGRAQQAVNLPDKVKALRQLVEERWDEKIISNDVVRHDDVGQISRVNSDFSSPLRKNSSRYGVSSNEWKRRLRRYHQLRADKGDAFKATDFARSFFLYSIYFSLIVATLYVILLVSPQHVSSPGGSSRDLLESLLGQISVWKIHSALDVIIFLDILLDFVLFLIAALVVEWPKPPLFAEHLGNKRRLENIDRNNNQNALQDDASAGSSSIDTESLSFVLKQTMSIDCCLLIACHESTLTNEKSESFSNTLRAALQVFPPSHIFVCDNGSSPAPVDDTQMVARSVHGDINYVYIPEGNKTFAFYWTNKYWIPFLIKCRVVPNFTYALIIDDDVPLPPDLHIPHEHLKQRSSEIKAVHFPITACTPPGQDLAGILVNCQDVEYKLAAVHKQFQSKLSRCLSCHGAIALWERETLEKIFFIHDTVFHGEEMYMGLSLLRKRDKSLIISAAQSIVPTYAPCQFSVLFRQRVKSWELTSHRKTVTYIKEILAPRSFCHVPSLVLKPYFLQEVITILLDWLRVYLLCGLFLRDWLGLLLMTSFFMALMYIQVLLFSFIVLRSRRNLAPSLFTTFIFPFYRLCGLLFRVCALCHNLLVYSHDRSAVKIGKREDEIKDIPPTPPAHTVDWFTVWLKPSM